MVAKCWLASAVLVSGQRSQEMLGGLQFGGVGRQEEQVDVFGHTQLDARMPARPVQDEHDLRAWAGADLTGKRGRFGLEEGDTDRGREVEDGAPQGRMHEAHQIAPVVAMLDRCEETLAVETPHRVQDRFQANPMFVDRPELDGGLWESGGDVARASASPF